MQGRNSSSQNFNSFEAAIRQSGSSDDYNSLGPYPKTKLHWRQFFGANQFGYLALADVGFVEKEGDLKHPEWTAYAASLGVTSVATFLKNKAAQDIAFERLIKNNEKSLSGYKSYIGKTIHTKTLGDVYITESGLLAAAHLKGFAAVEEFLSSGGSIDRMDGHNIHVSEYMAQFSGYNFTFDPKTDNFADTPNSAARDKIFGAERAKAIAFRAAHRIGIVHLGHHRRYVHPRGVAHSFLPHSGLNKRSATRGSRRARDLSPEPALPAAQRRSFALNMQGSVGCLLGSLRRMPLSSAGHSGNHFAMNRAIASDPLAGLVSGPYAHAVKAQQGRFPVSQSLNLIVASRSGQNIPSFAPPGGRESILSENSDEVTILQHRDLAADGWGGAGSRVGMNNSAEAEFRNSLARGGVMDQRPAFGAALEEYFMRQARLPPAGGTAFDPRLTPAWAGLKLPV